MWVQVGSVAQQEVWPIHSRGTGLVGLWHQDMMHFVLTQIEEVPPRKIPPKMHSATSSTGAIDPCQRTSIWSGISGSLLHHARCLLWSERKAWHFVCSTVTRWVQNCGPRWELFPWSSLMGANVRHGCIYGPSICDSCLVFKKFPCLDVSAVSCQTDRHNRIAAFPSWSRTNQLRRWRMWFLVLSFSSPCPQRHTPMAYDLMTVRKRDNSPALPCPPPALLTTTEMLSANDNTNGTSLCPLPGSNFPFVKRWKCAVGTLLLSASESG